MSTIQLLYYFTMYVSEDMSFRIKGVNHHFSSADNGLKCGHVYHCSANFYDWNRVISEGICVIRNLASPSYLVQVGLANWSN